MPRTYGNCGPVVTARAGIEIPDPRAPRLDIDAIRARVAARAALVDVDQGHEQADTVPAGPVVCDVCTQVVTAEYVARTGQRRHGPCQHRTTPAGTTVARSSGRRIRAGRARVRAVA